LSRFYQVHEFAELAGVTVKALHHYDRLGLLKPRRTSAGYRLYNERDLERLEQIVALKFLGIPLKQIRVVLDSAPLASLDALRMQRTVLEKQQRLLGRAILAITDAEKALATGSSADTAIWRRVIEVIDVQSEMEGMKKYYTEEAWLLRKQHYQQWPAPELQEIFRDIAAALGEDPAGERAQALVARLTNAVNQRVTGNPDVMEGAVQAWNDREHWPAPLRERVEEFKIDQILAFLGRVMAMRWKKYTASEAWAKLEERQRNPTEPWNEWYRRMRIALEEDPPGEKAVAMVTRLMEL
jgi:DNA-binding transcriptional MerR regulator